MITNVLMAKTIEFRVTRGTSSRIFHLGNASPLVFGLEEFLIGEDGKIIARVRNLYQNLCMIFRYGIMFSGISGVHFDYKASNSNLSVL